jgi:hypothetical protein
LCDETLIVAAEMLLPPKQLMVRPASRDSHVVTDTDECISTSEDFTSRDAA